MLAKECDCFSTGIKVHTDEGEKNIEDYQIHVGGQAIESTFNHPFYVKDKGWTFVKNLKAGNLLVQSERLDLFGRVPI